MQHLAFPKPKIPKVPGVYLWRKGDKILYIGKAKNLSNRLNSYYRKNHPDPKTTFLMREVETLEWVELDTEEEALLLEEELIKRYRPDYNIRLKDDKRYPYVAISDDKYPRIYVKHRPDVRGWRYWGPYSDARKMRFAIAALHRLFLDPLWGSNIQHYGNPPVSAETWGKAMKTIENILEGEKDWQDIPKARMDKAAKDLNFEFAAKVRDWIKAVEYLSPRRKLSDQNSYDVLGWAQNSEGANLQILQLRGDRLAGRRSYTFASGELPAAILEAYRIDPPPNKIYLSKLPAEHAKLSIALGTKMTTARASKLRYIEIAQKNAVNTLRYVQEHEKTHDADKVLASLGDLLGINPPARIECFDISNLGTSYPIAGMAVLTNGEITPWQYRTWKMEAAGQDDFSMIYWTVKKRLKAIGGTDKKLGAAPDLIVIDGGKGQLSAAKKAMDELNLNIPLISLAKRMEEVFLPETDTPLDLSSADPVSLLLQKVRDETHKTAVTRHRQVRNEAIISGDVLADVRGLGPKRKAMLMAKFGSFGNLMSASQSEIEQVLGTKAAEQIYRQLHR